MICIIQTYNKTKMESVIESVFNSDNKLEVKIERADGKLIRETYYKNDRIYQTREYGYNGILTYIEIIGNSDSITYYFFNFNGKLYRKIIDDKNRNIIYDYSQVNENKIIQTRYEHYSNITREPYLIEEFNEKLELIKSIRPLDDDNTPALLNDPENDDGNNNIEEDEN